MRIRIPSKFPCPRCGREFQPYDVEAFGNGWRLICTGCHTVCLEIEAE
jgi:transcription elongation factor Elf1